MFRISLGFLAAASWLPLLLYFTSDEFGDFWSVMVAYFTVPLTVFIAVPLFIVFSRRSNVGAAACLIFGFAVGLVGVLLFWLMTNQQAMLRWAVALVLSGVLSGFVFWIAGVWKNEFLRKSA